MIKHFKTQDIIVTDFVYSNEKDLETINSDLESYNLNINTSSFFQRGQYIPSSSIFYESGSEKWSDIENPINPNDYSYKRQIYTEVKNMYYNDYNNAYNIFGSYNFDKFKTNLNLGDTFLLLNFNVYQVGDNIQPGTVKMQNWSGDIIANVLDDNYGNLFLSGSYFVNKYSFTSSTDTLNINVGEYGISNYYLNNNKTFSEPSYVNSPLEITPDTFYLSVDDAKNLSFSGSYISSLIRIHYNGLMGSDFVAGIDIEYKSGSTEYEPSNDRYSGEIFDIIVSNARIQSTITTTTTTTTINNNTNTTNTDNNNTTNTDNNNTYDIKYFTGSLIII